MMTKVRGFYTLIAPTIYGYFINLPMWPNPIPSRYDRLLWKITGFLFLTSELSIS
jgi:hypothetical protein